ncbi:MAG: trigger factor [Planctomycetaceae bacterium]|jgi:trigger factor|nr:trigger factor [Planctomycetaceae bacterium]
MTNTEENIENVEDLNLTADVQKISSCERRVKVTVPQSEVESYFQKEFVELEKTAYVPGFRVGKAPRKLIEKRFKKDISDQVKHALVMNALTTINRKGDFTPISEPDLQYDSLVLPDEGPFVFEFNIEVRPEFDLPEWKGLKIEKPVRDFSPADIDAAIKQILANHGELEYKTEPAEPDDYIETKLTFKAGEQILSSIDHETIRIRPILSFHDGIINEVDTLLTGVKPGDVKTTQITLTEDAANPEFRGKTVDVVFEIQAVKTLVVPVLSEALLERLGGYQSEADFRDAILDTLQRQLEHEQQIRARQQITEALTINANWDLPPDLLKRQSEREFRRKTMELQRSGFNQEQIQAYSNYLRQNSTAETARALKEHFILEKIAEIENIEEATEEDFDSEIRLIAAQNNVLPRRVRAHIEKTGEMDILRNQIVERKVINLIFQHAAFTEVPFNFGTQNEEAVDWAVAPDPNAIAEVTTEDLKAVNKEIDAKKKIDPNVKIKGCNFDSTYD